jgi:histone-arginine methyltransferase CARM1
MSDIAIQARKLVKANGMEDKITILKGKIEEVELPEKVDIIVSEPLGFLLVHERMLESYIAGRDRWLKPGGKMFPSNSTIFTAPFTDQALYDETVARGEFWDNDSFMGIDFSCLQEQSNVENFGQPVVG